MHLFTAIHVLLMFTCMANIHPSICFQFDSNPPNRLVFVLDKNTTNVSMKWMFTLSSEDRFYSSMKLVRMESIDPASKTATLYSHLQLDPNTEHINTSFYSANRDIKNGPSSGSFTFTIKDMTKQINNKDGSPYINPLSKDYLYRLTIVVFTTESVPHTIDSKVFVYAPPTSPIALHVDKTTFNINETVNITCNAKTGNPPNTTVTFYRNNEKIRVVKNDAEARETITIHLDKPGIQTFTCQTSNLVGSSDNSSVLNLEVKAPPMSPSLQVDKATYCHLNATVNITCSATTGYPQNTNVTFYRSNEKIRVVKNDAEARATITVNLAKSGIQAFTCQTANLVGSSDNSSVLNLEVKDPPVISQCGNQTCTEGDPLSWKCDASGSPTLNTSWFKGKENTIVSSTKAYNITSVSKSHAGMYRFTVSNGDECPTASTAVYLNVQFPPSSATIHVDKRTVCLNETVNITCTATAGNPPNTTVTFYRNNEKIGEVNNNAGAIATVSINLDKSGMQAFTCQAANLVRSSANSSLINVNVKDPPVITQCQNQTSVEGRSLSWTCDAIGSQPLVTSWFKGHENTILSSTKTYNITSVSRSHAGMYRFTVSNGDECPTASTKVYQTVQYLRECSNNTKYTMTNKQCLEISPKGYPEPTVICMKKNFTKTGKNYTLCEPQSNDSCVISNAAGKCRFEIEVLPEAVEDLLYSCYLRCTNCTYKPELTDKNSTLFKELKKEFEKVLELVYKSYIAIISWLVTELREGSVIVYFNLTSKAHISDPLLPLKDAVQRGGNLNGFVIESSSIQLGLPPQTTTTTAMPTTISKTNTDEGLSTETYIGIGVAVAFVVIVIIVLICCLCKKKNDEKRSEEHLYLEEGVYYRTVNGEENRGMSDSSSYARSGPKSDFNGQTTNNNPEVVDEAPTYAAVDMSKKKKKKQEGEVVYADLGSVRPNGNNDPGTELQQMSSSGNIPEKQESEYASIDFLKTKQQGEVKEYEYLGTFNCSNRTYTKDLSNDTTDAFKKLRDEVNKTIKSAYTDDADFVLAEAEQFNWHPHGIDVVFKLILKKEATDPFLPLKEALEKNEGTVGELKIKRESVKVKVEDPQNATDEQKKAQKQDEANAAADMSSTRDHTTLTTVSL